MRSTLAALLAALVLAPAATAAPITASTTDDPADAAPAIDGNPRPDLLRVSVTVDTDARTASVVADFHAAVMPTTGGDLAGARLPVSLGKVSGRECGAGANGSPDLSASMVPATTGYAHLSVVGATGLVAADPAPAWNAERTQLTWGFTNDVFATAFDCISVGPLYGDVRSTASHPDSTYRTGCDCWVIFTAIDELAAASAWFSGREPPPPARQPLTTRAAVGAARNAAAKSRAASRIAARCFRVRRAAGVASCRMAYTFRGRRYAGIATVRAIRSVETGKIVRQRVTYVGRSGSSRARWTRFVT